MERGAYPVSRVECPQYDVSRLEQPDRVGNEVVLDHNHHVLGVGSGRRLVPRSEVQEIYTYSVLAH